MKPKFYILFSLLLNIYELNAQIALELGGGFTRNYIKQNSIANDASTTEPNSGYYFYGNFKIKETKKVSMKLGLQVVQKNYSIYRSNILHEKSENLYLVLPIVIQADLIKSGKVKILGDVGLGVGYLASRVIEGKVPNAFSASYELLDNGEVINNLNVTSYIIKDDFLVHENRIEVGAQIGLQLKYRYNQILSPVLNLSFHHTFSSTSNNDLIVNKIFNRTIVISIGTILEI